jgi:glycosyltransferase involved in cell wall biosynthesis
MRILMVTNTFTPHISGIARSIQCFTDQYRDKGHTVCVIAPSNLTGDPYTDDHNTIRIPAFENIGGSSFCLPSLSAKSKKSILQTSALFFPDIVHAHQPFLLGDLARLISEKLKVPLLYTQHCLYENFNHLLQNNQRTEFFLKDISTQYANLCDAVIAPSESIRQIMLQRGVQTPVNTLPNGTDIQKFARGNKNYWRNKLGIQETDFVIGHVGRLSPEKNLPLLATCMKWFLPKSSRSHFLLVGDGPSEAAIRETLANTPRAHLVGSRSGQELIDAYHAMDVFAFPSLIDVGPLVLAEAMAAGVPVAAFNAQGSKDIVQDGVNGRLVEPNNIKEFGKAIAWCLRNKKTLQPAIKQTARRFGQEICADRVLALYKQTNYRPKSALKTLAFAKALAAQRTA